MIAPERGPCAWSRAGTGGSIVGLELRGRQGSRAEGGSRALRAAVELAPAPRGQPDRGRRQGRPSWCATAALRRSPPAPSRMERPGHGGRAPAPRHDQRRTPSVDGARLRASSCVAAPTPEIIDNTIEASGGVVFAEGAAGTLERQSRDQREQSLGDRDHQRRRSADRSTTRSSGAGEAGIFVYDQRRRPVRAQHHRSAAGCRAW